MAITAYVGLPGHGKSYTVVEHVILPALKAGRQVVTNVALHEEVVRKKFPGCTLDLFPLDVIAAEPHRVLEFAMPGSVVVVDEIWKLFPAGVKANQVHESFKAWLAEHRHMVNASGDSMQIVFVTQDLAQISAFARQLVEQTFVTTKLVHLGSSKRYRVDVYDRGLTSGQMSPGKRRREMLGRFESKVWKYYRSHTQSEHSEDGARELAVDRRGVVWKSPLWWLGVPSAVICGMFGVSVALEFFGGGAAAPAHAAQAASPASGERVGIIERAVEPRIPTQRAAEVPDLRLAGWTHGADGKGSAMIQGEHGYSIVPWSDCWQAGDGLTRCTFAGHVVSELGVGF